MSSSETANAQAGDDVPPTFPRRQRYSVRTAGGFAATFARHPARPRRGLLPGRRVWATIFGATALAAVCALALPLIASIDFGDKEGAKSTTVAERAGAYTASRRTPGSGVGPATVSPSSAAPPSRTSTPSAKPPAKLPHLVRTRKSGSARQQHPAKTSTHTLHRAARPAPARYLVGAQSGRCIDVTGGHPNDGTHLQIWDCNHELWQQWTFEQDGTLRSMGMCMDVAWGSHQNGAVIQLVNCNGNVAQQFRLSPAGDLVNTGANKCVDVVDQQTRNGTALQLWDCNGQANQKWGLIS
jgi:hypothetical protein